MKKKIILVIESKQYYRNLVSSGALSDIFEAYEVGFLVEESLKNITWPTKLVVHYRSNLNTWNPKFNILMNDIKSWQLRHLSSSFAYRHERLYPSFSFLSHRLLLKLRSRGPKVGSFNNKKSDNKVQWKKIFKLFIYGKIVRVFSVRPLDNLIAKLARVDQLYETDLYRKLVQFNPELVIYPNSGYEPLANQLITICRLLRIDSYFIVDNWDNLSSKTAMTLKPSFMGVWGIQSKVHAVDIHRMNPEDIFVLGSARFTVYKKAEISSFQDNLPDNYILFLGSFQYFDEISVLKRLEAEILRNPMTYGDLKIVYRPHPAGSNLKRFRALDFTVVILDNGFLNLREEMARDLGNHSLYHNLNLFKAAKFVVGGLTSMLLESGIMERQFLGLVHPELNNMTSPDIVFKRYLHFRGIESLNHLQLCFDLEELDQKFRDMFISPQIRDIVASNKAIDFFVCSEVESFPLRLRRSIEIIFSRFDKANH